MSFSEASSPSPLNLGPDTPLPAKPPSRESSRISGAHSSRSASLVNAYAPPGADQPVVHSEAPSIDDDDGDGGPDSANVVISLRPNAAEPASVVTIGESGRMGNPFLMLQDMFLQCFGVKEEQLDLATPIRSRFGHSIVLVNPRSGIAQGERTAALFVALFASHRIPSTVVLLDDWTNPSKHPLGVVSSVMEQYAARQEDQDVLGGGARLLVISCGGDGTHCSVLGAMIEAIQLGVLRESPVCLTVPIGTGNMLPRECGWGVGVPPSKIQRILLQQQQQQQQKKKNGPVSPVPPNNVLLSPPVTAGPVAPNAIKDLVEASSSSKPAISIADTVLSKEDVLGSPHPEANDVFESTARGSIHHVHVLPVLELDSTSNSTLSSSPLAAGNLSPSQIVTQDSTGRPRPTSPFLTERIVEDERSPPPEIEPVMLSSAMVLVRMLGALPMSFVNNIDSWSIRMPDCPDSVPKHANRMFSFFSIGWDAAVMFDWHDYRTRHPKFSSRSRTFSKAMTAWFGMKRMVKGNPRIGKFYSLVIDGSVVEIPPEARCIVLINHASYANGSCIYQPSRKERRKFAYQPQNSGDGLIEVVAMRNPFSLVTFTLRLSRPWVLGQGSSVRLVAKEPQISKSLMFPFQTDGEAWWAAPKEVEVSHGGSVKIYHRTAPKILKKKW